MQADRRASKAMSRRRLWRVLGAALVLVLTACNYPTSAPTPTELSLDQIEAAVGATLLAEGRLTQAAIPPSATRPPATEEPSASHTPPAIATPSPTPSPTLTATYTPRPSDTPNPTDTPKPTSPPLPTKTPEPSATQCAKFTNPALSGKAGIGNQVDLTWSSSGGCAPVSGQISAAYVKDATPFATLKISGNSGKVTNQPPVKCEGTFMIRYVLVLQDASGGQITTSIEVQVTWIC